jgi:hypothetical protein
VETNCCNAQSFSTVDHSDTSDLVKFYKGFLKHNVMNCVIMTVSVSSDQWNVKVD